MREIRLRFLRASQRHATPVTNTIIEAGLQLRMGTRPQLSLSRALAQEFLFVAELGYRQRVGG